MAAFYGINNNAVIKSYAIYSENVSIRDDKL